MWDIEELKKDLFWCFVVFCILAIGVMWPYLKDIPLECFFSSDTIICAKLS